MAGTIALGFLYCAGPQPAKVPHETEYVFACFETEHIYSISVVDLSCSILTRNGRWLTWVSQLLPINSRFPSMPGAPAHRDSPAVPP